MGRSEELGTGIRNVFKYSKAYSGSDKVVFSEEDIFVTQVPLGDLDDNGGLNRNVTDNVTDNVTNIVTDRKDQIIILIKENNSISTSEIANKLNVSKRTILREIDLLKIAGIIKREGKEKTGYWLLKDKLI
jgi:ATP-dependent DNA helicase RecG